ncbi:capsid maturation protease [Streptomyces phage Sycamore]|uniref:Capsid maturation protease n=1 Tax=Streptomyces phage Sycamore TaxID=2767589 RepID=A0A873WGT2_9CAUD|nr:capsid maturation protease [Streptomyces phage Sycamore]
MTQADIDRASRAYYDEQLAISAGLINSVLRWWRTLSWRAVQTDSDALWETYRDMVSDARDRSHTAGTEYHNRIRELALDHPSTFRGGERDSAAEARQAATSFFVQTAPVTREIQRGRLDDPEFVAELDEFMSRAGTNLARDGGRLAEQGGRDALADARDNDPEVIGYYRKTDADPCGFCAMLASRGLVYTESRNSSRRTRSWVDEQDPDQYHPDCHCQTLPLFQGVSMPAEDRRKADEYERLWKDTEGSGAEQLKNFRDAFDADRRARRANA